MGEELVSGSILPNGERVDNDTLSSFSYTDILNSYLPFYISIGMTVDQYWNEDVDLCTYYNQAFELRKKRKNEELWLQGLYIYEAIMDNAPILRGLSKATKPAEYSKEPYALSEKEQQYRKERDERLRFKKMIEKMADMAAIQNTKKEDDIDGSSS